MLFIMATWAFLKSLISKIIKFIILIIVLFIVFVIIIPIVRAVYRRKKTRRAEKRLNTLKQNQKAKNLSNGSTAQVMQNEDCSPDNMISEIQAEKNSKLKHLDRF